MAFDFFRKYQRPILLTAGLFAVITFSISVPLYGFIDYLTAKPYKGPELTLPDGRVVAVTLEDLQQVGEPIARGQLGIVVVLPRLEADDGEQRDSLSSRYAALRRLAIEAGIGVAEADIDAVIQQAITLTGQPDLTPTRLALSLRHPSLATFRTLVGEALRISTYLRIMSLSGDVTDAALARHLLSDMELIQMKVATVDKAAIEKTLKETPVSDDDLRAWLDGLSDSEKTPYLQPNNKVALTAAGLLFEGFDPSAFTAELGDQVIGEDMIRQRYDLDRELRYRKPKTGEAPPGDGPKDEPKEGDTPKEGEKLKEGGNGDGAPQNETGRQEGTGGEETKSEATKPGENETATAQDSGLAIDQQQDGPKPEQDPYIPFEQVKDQIQKALQAEAAIKAIWAKVQEAMVVHMRPAVDQRNHAYEAHAAAQKAMVDADAALATGPATPELTAAAEAAKTSFESGEAAKKAADEAVQSARVAFPMPQTFMDLVKDRADAARVVVVAEPKLPEGLKDLSELGTWERSWTASMIDTPGDLSSQVQTTDKAVFYFQVTAVEQKSLKDFAEIKERLTDDYYKRKADAAGKERMKAFEDALFRLAREARAEAITKLEAEKATKLDQQLTEWRDQLQKDLTEATTQRELQHRRDPKGRDFRRWEAREKELQQVLATEEAKRAELEKVLAETTDAEIRKEARMAYKDVFDAAAAEAGITPTMVGPYARNLSTQPRFADRFEPHVRFLFQTSFSRDDESVMVREMKEGEVSDLLDDATNRALHLALVTSIEKADISSLTRREILAGRAGFISDRMSRTFQQSFSREALEARYNYRIPVGDEADALER